MSFVSQTRLRIRSIRFLPFFAFHTWRSLKQVKSAPGFLTGALLPDRSWTFWAMTAWENQESMRQYMVAGSLKTAMAHLLEWCDEASVAHWMQPDATLLSWAEADIRMRKEGRPSKMRSPSSQYADLSYRVPRTTAGAKILRS